MLEIFIGLVILSAIGIGVVIWLLFKDSSESKESAIITNVLPDHIFDKSKNETIDLSKPIDQIDTSESKKPKESLLTKFNKKKTPTEQHATPKENKIVETPPLPPIDEDVPSVEEIKKQFGLDAEKSKIDETKPDTAAGTASLKINSAEETQWPDTPTKPADQKPSSNELEQTLEHQEKQLSEKEKEIDQLSQKLDSSAPSDPSQAPKPKLKVISDNDDSDLDLSGNSAQKQDQDNDPGTENDYVGLQPDVMKPEENSETDNPADSSNDNPEENNKEDDDKPEA